MDRSYLGNYLDFLLSIDPFLLSFLLSFLMNKELDLIEWELSGLCSRAGEPATICFFFFEIFDIFLFHRKEVLSFRNPNNIPYLNLSGIHRKRELLRIFIFDQLRYLETIFFFIISSFEIRIRSEFFFYFCIFSTLDSRTNRRITTKKQRLDS